ncbi:hypothetical protein P3X46_004870 [Hevea brasiliensis]|uniref:DUF3741 domain-containing protein n=1 Tax=Hevea brasiliensis TaxID=3981 RepID=A0ABQ9MY18_HEVBR|nr:hypothetical protein P3X46_004870 [Hevea brasiliensis]
MLPISVEGKNSDETGNHLGHNQVDETGKQLIENHLILDNSDSEKQNLAHPKELNVNASPNQSREVLDALVMINMNREFLLKIIQDPGKPQSKEYFRSKSMPSIAADYRMDRILKLNQAMSETVDTSSSSSVHHRKTKHFKDIKHSKNEKHRITTDAVLHKVPHGHEFPNNLKSHSMSRDDKESSISSNNNSQLRRMSRTSSLNESLDRYCQLYESSFNKEPKRPSSETSESRTKDSSSPPKNASNSMRRTLSSPNLKSYLL